MLSYAEHGRSRAIAQERTSSRFSPQAKKRDGRGAQASLASAFAALRFRIVLRIQWTTAAAVAQGANGVPSACVCSGSVGGAASA